MALWKQRDSVITDIYALFTKNLPMAMEMAKREIRDRYTRQIFGLFWAVLHPTIQIAIYLFIFLIVFKVKLEATGRSVPVYDYSTYILSGLIPWFAMQESMSKGCTVITSNMSLVKQVIFPVEVLPVKTVIATEVTQCVMLVLLTGYLAVTGRIVSWMYLMVPVLFFLQFLLMCGLAFILSVVGIYFRDMKDFIQVFCISGIYIMPIFYLPNAVPQLFRPLLYVNPFSYMIWCYQDAVCFCGFDHWYAWIAFTVMSLLCFYVGFALFRKVKIIFGSIL